MKIQPKKETQRTMTNKSTSDLQRLEREKRLQIREEIREQVIVLQRRMTTEVTEQERNPPELGHDRQEEGVDEEVAPMEEYFWIDQREALQLEIPQEVRPLSPMNPST